MHYSSSDSENPEFETEDVRYNDVGKIVPRMLVTIKPADLQAVPGVLLIFSRLCTISNQPKEPYLVKNVTVL